MAKNLSYCRMFEIAGDPSNQMEAQDSIDNSTKVIKGPEGAVKVTMTEEDKNQVSSNNETKSFPDPVSMVDSLQTNQVGKYDVSVAAKAVQACSMIQYAYDSLLNSDAPEEKSVDQNFLMEDIKQPVNNGQQQQIFMIKLMKKLEKCNSLTL